jgi:hypothetical protein
VLALAVVAEAHAPSGWFGPTDIAEIFETFKVPPASNVPRELARLRDRGLATNRTTKPGWALSPEGRVAARSLLGDVELSSAAVETAGLVGAELGHALHTALPPQLAPLAWRTGIRQMLEEHPFETNVFCMTRFPETESDTAYLDPVRDVIPVVRDALAAHGLTLHLASTRQLDDDLYGNIAAHMWACKHGVALFEDRLGRGLNHNMIIEVGSMLITGRRCALLKDETIERMPTDFVGRIYKDVSFSDLDAIAQEIHAWAARDLGLGDCLSCPSG